MPMIAILMAGESGSRWSFLSSTSERAARLRASALCAADVTLFALVFGLGVSKSPMANLFGVRVRVRVRVRVKG